MDEEILLGRADDASASSHPTQGARGALPPRPAVSNPNHKKRSESRTHGYVNTKGLANTNMDVIAPGPQSRQRETVLTKHQLSYSAATTFYAEQQANGVAQQTTIENAVGCAAHDAKKGTDSSDSELASVPASQRAAGLAELRL